MNELLGTTAPHRREAPITPTCLGDAKTLARHDRRSVKPVRLLELPHAGTRVSSVALDCDRPQRLPRLDTVDTRRRAGPGVAREHGPDEDEDERDDDNACEHVFAL